MNILTRTLFASLLGALIACTGNRGRSLDELTKKDVSQSYVAKKGDSLMVKVWNEPQLTGEVFVRDDGRFTMPLINDVEAEGRALEDIAAEVSKKLQKFIASPNVSVLVAHPAPIRYYLNGSFQAPGEYRTETSITLLQAIATAKGFAPFADESAVTIIRRGPQGEMRYVLDYNRVLEGQEPNPEIKDGDTIIVK